MRIFVTGGAGFIGEKLTRALVKQGARVFVYDSLHAQVHGAEPRPRADETDLIFTRGDVGDRPALARALANARPEIVIHLAAETGTGQSLDEIARYCAANVMGTAHLVEAMRALDEQPRRVVLASSRAIYGEGAYLTADGRLIVPPPRSTDAMRQGRFLPQVEGEGPLRPVATPEDAPARPGSVYAATKLMQEHLLLQAAEVAPWSTVVLRFQNVYGPGQSLNNPYTGVLSIFTRALLAGRGINVFEDGQITRDFIFVDDAVEALVKASEVSSKFDLPLNIGTGQGITILQAAEILAAQTGRSADAVSVNREFRPGDVRHAVADIRRAGEMLDWRPATPFQKGAAALVDWAKQELAPLPAGTA